MRAVRSITKSSETAFKGTLCPLTLMDLNELWLLDLRVFTDGEAYERDTFRQLLSNPQGVARQIRTADGKMVAFAIGVIEEDGVGHITTIGVSPDHRRRGLAKIMLLSIEQGFAVRGATTVRLEVRTDNNGARQLYEQIGYTITQRMRRYYSTGDDGYLMVKAINGVNWGF
ncbi:MAG TPA: N-acetyltransferase [Blastocatellia bacterium]|nr:N-acetyltransferase [Blastocatellia bacterium]